MLSALARPADPKRFRGDSMRVCRLGALILGLLLPLPAAAQDLDVDAALIEETFPGVTRVGQATGTPPVYKAYGADGAQIGFLFLTSDWPPEESGYSGTILSLVGMDMKGTITGARILDYRESLRSSRGDFLRGRFEDQFSGKTISDPFRVRRDVSNVSGATISTAATARGIRNAARRVANTYLRSAAAGPVGEAEVAELEWDELVSRNYGDRLQGTEKGILRIELYLVPLRSEAEGRLIMGDTAYAKSAAKLGERATTRQLWFVGVDGGLEALFRASALTIVRGADTLKFTPQDLVLAGEPKAGKVDSQYRNVGLIATDPSLDPKQPFTWHLRFGGGIEPFSAEHPGERRVVAAAPASAPTAAAGAPDGPTTGALPGGASPDGMTPGAALPGVAAPDAALPAATEAAAAGQVAPLVDDLGLEFADEEEETVLQRTLAITDWRHFGLIAFLLVLASAAFFSKNPTLRWVSLGATLLVLGVGSASRLQALGGGGFLSVSHITSPIKVGMGVFLEDLPLLLFVGFTVITTLLWGRVFCGYLCPFGALQDFLEMVVPKRIRRKLPHPVHESGLYLKYGVLAVILIWALAGPAESGGIFHWFEPFGTVFFPSTSVALWLIAGSILVASAIIPRFYCRYMCPLGAALGLTSLLSPFRIKRVQQCQVCTMCEQSCPTGAIKRESIDFKECVRCNVCEVRLIEKAGVCKHDLDKVAHLIQLKRGQHNKHQTFTPGAVHGD